MKRFQQRTLFGGLPPLRALGLMTLLGFALFVSFRIFTVPSETVQRVTSPDGSREARLQSVYYSSDPGLKVAVRRKLVWQTLLYLHEYTNAPAGLRTAGLRWSPDSRRLYLEVAEETVWQHDFGTE